MPKLLLWKVPEAFTWLLRSFNFHLCHAEKWLHQGYISMSWHFHHLYSQAWTVMQTKELLVKITFLWSCQGAGFQWVQWLNGASHLQWQGQRVRQNSAETTLLLPSSITLNYFFPQFWEFSFWNEEQMVCPQILLDVWPKTIETLIVLPFTTEILDWLLNHLSIGTQWVTTTPLWVRNCLSQGALQRYLLQYEAGLPFHYWRDVEIHFLFITQMN